MAGSSVTQTNEHRGPIGAITLACVADDTDGSFPETVLAAKISGKLLALETNPGATAPQANYDIVLDDADGHDVLEGVGADRHTSSTEKVPIVYGTYFHPPVVKSDVLTLKITGNNVNDAITVVKLYYEGALEG